MDGLMFNTEDLYNLAGERLLEPRGQKFTRELKLAMMGLPGKEAFAVMIDHCNLDDSVEQLQTETDQIFQTLLPEKIEMMPGLQTLLAAIDDAGLPRAVATSSHRNFADRALGHFDLQAGFQFVLTAEDVTNGKPDPEVYLTAGDKLGVAADSMLVLEDSVFGSRAAVAAGAFTVAIPTEFSRDQDYSHADAVVDRLDSPEVLKWIKHRHLPAKLGN
jgi:HAD superfamily hydrolase (TIGR01509 family)